MEKIMLFCVFSYLIIQISSSGLSEHDVTLLRFRLNENITLNCSINDQFTYRFEMAWYHQNPESGRLTLLLSAKNWPSLHIQYSQNNRMRVHGDVESNTASLDIIGLTESDSGLYFCAIVHSILYFDKPIRLVMEDKLTDREDKVQSVTDPSVDDKIPDASEHNVTLLRFQLNETITLNCSMTHTYEIAWYHQDPESGRLTLLIFAIGRRKEIYLINQNTRVTVKADIRSNTVSLIITGLMESDSGLYFCGTRSATSDMYFEKPIRLQIEDKLTDREDEAHSGVEITDWLALTERVLMFGGVGLAVLVFFLVIIIAGRNIYCQGWRKGWIAAEHVGLNVQKSPKRLL
ncbi:uncharacterized protein LOC109081328 isoform X1 [Cyprinus carpio]|uniref:Uncharacterized protein LOC109081328 isoform X1 n=1 Tax=Cyprinus carpio TaxID=7962 RepID=A0A9R0AKB9_CYPCA|nr:uncharacterized protein LOC109081328 isoform X1 [Cyprinus carpio]